jgi:hypothetical protein
VDGRMRKKLGKLAVNMKRKMEIVRTVKQKQTIGTVKRERLVRLNKGFKKQTNSINGTYNMFSNIYYLSCTLLVVTA